MLTLFHPVKRINFGRERLKPGLSCRTIKLMSRHNHAHRTANSFIEKW
jgi:hypothetical protein